MWKIRQFNESTRLAAVFNLGHVFFLGLFNFMYRQRLKDPFSMFKVFRRECLYGLTFECNRFDFDFEIVIKLLRKGYRPIELPVNYRARSPSEGKKVIDAARSPDLDTGFAEISLEPPVRAGPSITNLTGFFDRVFARSNTGATPLFLDATDSFGEDAMHWKMPLQGPMLGQVEAVLTTAHDATASSGRDVDSVAAIESPPMRAVELWIPSCISLLVGLRWLLVERHSVYGDEGFHLNVLSSGFANAMHGGLFERLHNLYLFHFVYPPVFHVLAAPFVLPAADPVFGGRVYAQVLTLCASICLYSLTRKIGGKLAGVVAVLTLLGTPSFVDPSRHYLLETLITVEVLALLYVLARYYDGRRLRDLLFIACILSAGLLTKFNFFFYAVWLFIVPAAIECYKAVRDRQNVSSIVTFGGLVVVAPLVVAGPWYWARATSPSNALELLGHQLEAGHSIANLSLDLILFPIYWNYSVFVTALGVAAAATYVASLLRLRGFRSCLGPISQSQHVILAGVMVAAGGLLPGTGADWNGIEHPLAYRSCLPVHTMFRGHGPPQGAPSSVTRTRCCRPRRRITTGGCGRRARGSPRFSESA